MLETVLTVPFWLELAAALTGGISGAMSAVRERYDVFGTISIACTCGLFGGIMRDLLLQDYGIYAFQKPSLIVCCALAGILVFFFGKLVSYLDPIVDLLDNLSCGLWAVISVGKGLSAGLDIVPSIILGTITAIGGGVMRDVFMNRHPETFQAGALYGSASFIGSAAFALMKQNHLLEAWAPFVCVGLILAVRYASLIFGLHTSPPTDYSDVVTKTVSRPVKAVARHVHPPKNELERKKEPAENRKAYRKIRFIQKRPDVNLDISGSLSGLSDRLGIKRRPPEEDLPEDPFEPSTPDPKNKRD